MQKRRPPMSVEQEKQILEMDAQGILQKDIAAALGLRYGTVRQRITVLRRRQGEPGSTAPTGHRKPTPAPASRPATSTPTAEASLPRRGPGAPIRPDALTRTAQLQAVYLDPLLRRELKARAALAGVTVSALVAEALEAYFAARPTKL